MLKLSCFRLGLKCHCSCCNDFIFMAVFRFNKDNLTQFVNGGIVMHYQLKWNANCLHYHKKSCEKLLLVGIWFEPKLHFMVVIVMVFVGISFSDKYFSIQYSLGTC